MSGPSRGTMRSLDFTKRTNAWLQNKNLRLSDEHDLPAHIAAAVRQYSKDRPLEAVADLDGVGTSDVVLPATFIDGFSQVLSVEYPIGDLPATLIDENERELYRTPTTLVLRFLVDTPASASANIRLTYTGYHSQGVDEANGTASTIPDADFDAVCALAASYAATQIVQSYTDAVEPGSDAAFVQGDDRAEGYRRAAKELRAIYTDMIGLGRPDEDKASKHGQSFIDLDSRGPAYGDTITHPRRWT